MVRLRCGHCVVIVWSLCRHGVVMGRSIKNKLEMYNSTDDRHIGV